MPWAYREKSFKNLGTRRFVSTSIITVVVLGSLSSCSDSVDGEAGESSCPATVEWSGVIYDQEEAGQELEKARRLGNASLLSCDDDNGQRERNVTSAAWALAGVDPASAIGVEQGGSLFLYVAEGTADVCKVKYTQCK